VPPFTDQVGAGGQNYGLDTGYRDVPHPHQVLGYKTSFLIPSSPVLLLPSSFHHEMTSCSLYSKRKRVFIIKNSQVRENRFECQIPLAVTADTGVLPVHTHYVCVLTSGYLTLFRLHIRFPLPVFFVLQY